MKKTNYGPKHLYNPDFEYIPASKTNIAETFKRIREKREAEAKQHQVIKFKGK